MLLDKYANTGILPDFFPFVVKSADFYTLYPYNYSTQSTPSPTPSFLLIRL